jgi:hypothetical protein
MSFSTTMVKYTPTNPLDLSSIRQYLGTIQRNAESSSHFFTRMEMNSFAIDLCAGDASLCEPLLYYDNLLYYQKIQVHLHEFTGPDSQYSILTIAPFHDSRFEKFSWAQYFTYFDSSGKSYFSYTGSFIPMNQVCQMLKDLYRISRLKSFY